MNLDVGGAQMLIAVALGLACWVAAIGYLVAPSMEYWQSASQIEAARQAARARFDEEDRRKRAEKLEEQLEALVRDVLAVLLFIVGLGMMDAVLPAWKVAAIFFGLASLGAAWWTFRRYRRNWQNFAQGDHQREVLLHLAGIIILPIVGVLLLTSVF